MDFEQMSFFSNQSTQFEETKKEKAKVAAVSQRILDEFGIVQVPFMGCNYEQVYPKIHSIVPQEEIQFDKWSLEQAIACEMVCASICHQMNWDYLRSAVYAKTQQNTSWLHAEYLLSIPEDEIEEMFAHYPKRERIRPLERTAILRDLGKLVKLSGGFINIFFDSQNKQRTKEDIYNKLLCCTVFSLDPGHKKLHLLFQKLSSYPQLNFLADYCAPAIDYHLLRCFLRRGLIYPKTKFASNFISRSETERKESTVGALRHLCANLINDISQYTGLDINSINVIEWHVGRSICTQEAPDCLLASNSSFWAKEAFDKCPFFDTCNAAKYDNEFLSLVEPTYNGTSY